jgi:isocitrate dehydrogenase (NAD+)
LDKALLRLTEIIETQKKRIEAMKENSKTADYNKPEIIIGVAGGDGIGPIITQEAARVLERALQTDIAAGRVKIKRIEGLTIENRLAVKKAVPDDVLAEIKSCDILLKGPTTTPEKGQGVLNVESANVALRKELDLYANIRPVKVPESQIDWVFFRENTEGAYAVGNMGIDIGDLSIDFVVTTTQGTIRFAKAAFEHARKNGRKRVSVVTKANVIKTTDGKFLEICAQVAKDYPEIYMDSWYIDIMTAKLLDERRRREFEVFILPNLYGDILTDEAAEIQGGVGTAGAANIGDRHAMFEAVHGSAPRMVKEGRANYADPRSVIRASAMALRHIGRINEAKKIDDAIDESSAVKITGRADGATCKDIGDFIISKV